MKKHGARNTIHSATQTTATTFADAQQQRVSLNTISPATAAPVQEVTFYSEP